MTRLEPPPNTQAPVVPPATMQGLLQAIRAGDGQDSVTLGDILSKIGSKSFPTLLLVIGLLMVSPLSSVPLLPALLAIVIVMTCVQALVGRKTLWLPRRVITRPISGERLNKALDWLAGTANWLDRRRSGWLPILATRPFSDIGYAVIAVSALSWPPLSLVPLSTTIIAVGMTFVAAGLTLRDGVFLLVGYVWLGALVSLGIAVLTGLF